MCRRRCGVLVNIGPPVFLPLGQAPLPTVIARAAIFRKRFLAGIAIGKASVTNTGKSGAGLICPNRAQPNQRLSA